MCSHRIQEQHPVQRSALPPVVAPRVLGTGFPVCSLRRSGQRHDRIRPEHNRPQFPQCLLNIASQLIGDGSDRCISPGVLPEISVINIRESLQLSQGRDPPPELSVGDGSDEIRCLIKVRVFHLRELRDRIVD